MALAFLSPSPSTRGRPKTRSALLRGMALSSHSTLIDTGPAPHDSTTGPREPLDPKKMSNTQTPPSPMSLNSMLPQRYLSRSNPTCGVLEQVSTDSEALASKGFERGALGDVFGQNLCRSLLNPVCSFCTAPQALDCQSSSWA